MGKSKAISSLLTLSLATSWFPAAGLLGITDCSQDLAAQLGPEAGGQGPMEIGSSQNAQAQKPKVNESYTPAGSSFWLTFLVWRLPREEKKEFWQLGDSQPFTPRRFLCGKRTLLIKTAISLVVFLSANELSCPCFSELSAILDD